MIKLLKKLTGFKTKKTPSPKKVAKLAKKKRNKSLRYFQRLFYAKELISQIRNTPGHIVECGVGAGGTLLGWSMITHLEGPVQRQIWGFDTFEGLPASTEKDLPRVSAAGQKSFSQESVMRYLFDSGIPMDWIEKRVVFKKGLFQDTCPQYDGGPIALLHIDADLYDSYQHALESLYPLVSSGGIVAFDEDLNDQRDVPWPGARRAIQDYFKGQPISLLQHPIYGKYYLIKP